LLFCDILLCVLPTIPDELDRLSVAVDLARRLNSRLNGVFVSRPGGPEIDWAQVLFERAVAKSSLETTWRVVDGSANEALLNLMRRSDLTILPCAGTVRGASAHPAFLPEQLTFLSGRPALILPGRESHTAIGTRVLVGWNNTRESTRAMHDSIPILAVAEKVHLLTVVPDRKFEPVADLLLLRHLRQHGVDANLERCYNVNAAERLATELHRTDSDLLVIGLHRKAGREQPNLGDVSRRFVGTGSLSVFCAY